MNSSAIISSAMISSAMKIVLLACVVATAVAQKAGTIRRLDGVKVSAVDADRFAAEELKADGVTGAQIAILNHGRLVWSHAYGMRDVGKNLPMTTDTNVWAASITKAVFATWVMRLVDEGKVTLDEPVAKMLPKPLTEYERYRTIGTELVKDPRWALVTPRMLLSHTAGFANFSELEPDKKIHLHFAPGTRFAYCGECMNMMGFVLEQTLGVKVDEAMARDIFEPLGMTQTGMVWQAGFDENAGLRYDAKGNLIGATHRVAAKAAGSMTTSAEDLARFYEALLAGKILRAETEKEMLTEQIAIHATHQFPTFEATKGNDGEAVGLGYALGWGVLTHTKYGPAFFKEGHGDGAENYSICFERNGDCLIVLTNSDNGELAFRPLVEKLMGDAGIPWVWEGYTRTQVMANEEHAK